MKAITVPQPYAWAMVESKLGPARCRVLARQSPPRRDELGRTLAIHAAAQLQVGTATSHAIGALRAHDCGVSLPPPKDLAFGAFVGSARLIGWIRYESRFATACDRAPGVDLPADWYRIAEDAWVPHAMQPKGVLWVFDRPLQLGASVAWRGQMGVWDVPKHVEQRLQVAALVARRVG